MKKRYAQVLLFVILMINSLSIYGMFTTQAYRAGQRGTQRAVAARSAVQASQPQQFSRQYSRATPQEGELGSQNNQSWWSRLWSGSAVPSERPVGQSINLSRLRTFLYGKLTPEEFVKELEKCIVLRQGKWRVPGSRFFREGPLFDDNDLAKAKQLIDENKELINKDVQDRESTWHSKYAPDSYGTFTHLTVLDRVLNAIFRPSHMIYAFHASDRELKLIELLKYLISIGAVISPENKSEYEAAYLHRLMDSYRKLYEGRSLYGVEYELDRIKKLFKELDPILEQLMPEFKEKLHEFQRERLQIEANEEGYKAKMQDKNDRAEYLREKIKHKEIEWRYRHNNWSDSWNLGPRITKEWENVQFDEQEYQQWLKNGKSFFKFNFKFDSGSGSYQQPPRRSSVPSKTFQELLGLPASATHVAIMKAYRTFLKENHPDHLQSLVLSGAMTKAEADTKIEKVKQVNDAYDHYKLTRPKVARKKPQGANE